MNITPKKILFIALKVLWWAVVVLMLTCALVYLPSIAGALMSAAVVIALPIKKVRGLLARLKISGLFKGILVAILFFAGVFFTPTTPTKDLVDSGEDDNLSQSQENIENPEKEGSSLQEQHMLPSGISLTFEKAIENDVTGNWRLSVTSNNVDIADYALEYYGEMFSSDDEIHAVLNTDKKTTTRISKAGNFLYVDTFAYVSGEENDSKLLFTGELLDSIIIDVETGELFGDDTTPEKESNVVQGDLGSSDESASNESSEKQEAQNSGGGGNNPNTYDNPEQQKTSKDYVLNSGTMKFHYPSCSSVKKISPENYSTFSGSRDDVIAKGYSPCGNCHP